MKKMFPNDECPIYEILFQEDDNIGIRMVSLVQDPAIEVKGVALSKYKESKYEFKKIGDQMIIVGPALIPELKIPRDDEDGDLYFIKFSADTIKKLMRKFNKENNSKSINIDHTTERVNGYIAENWIIEDQYYDKSKLYGFDLPVGTWMICVKIDDQEFWDKKVKEEGRYSFSIEGILARSPMKYSAMKYSAINIIDSLNDDELIDIIQELFDKKKA